MNTNCISRKSRSLLAGGITAAAIAGLAVPASATDSAAGSYIVDKDTIALTAPAGHVTGQGTEFHANGRIQVQVHGNVHRSGGAPCVFSRVIFTYADESTGTYNSPRACVGESADRAVDIHSKSDKDVVRYAVQLRSAADTVSSGTAISGSTYVVGDAPDSSGAKARLDRDALSVVLTGTQVFAGQTEYGIEKASFPGGSVDAIRSRVTGSFTWTDKLPGDKADLKVRWTYEGGATDTKTLASIGRGGHANVDAKSSPVRDVRKVEIWVSSHGTGVSDGIRATATPRFFGDYLRS